MQVSKAFSFVGDVAPFTCVTKKHISQVHNRWAMLFTLVPKQVVYTLPNQRAKVMF
jgi:hypothetical protein